VTFPADRPGTSQDDHLIGGESRHLATVLVVAPGRVLSSRQPGRAGVDTTNTRPSGRWFQHLRVASAGGDQPRMLAGFD
jgi:hypothetical protein